MPKRADRLIFSGSPEVEYAGNFFKEVPVILEYEDTPLIEVVQEQAGRFTTQFTIFNKDSLYIAKVKGSQLYPAKEGSGSNLKLRHPKNTTVCELDGRTIFEVRRKDAAALRVDAELFTPDGRFLKASDRGIPSELISRDGSSVRIRGLVMVGCYCRKSRVGVHISSTGGAAICRK